MGRGMYSPLRSFRPNKGPGSTSLWPPPLAHRGPPANTEASHPHLLAPEPVPQEVTSPPC